MVTRADVAKRANVSVSAVSRTMNGHGYVKKEKREAILNAVQELGYRSNPLSHSLKNGQTKQICYYVSDMYNPYYIDMYNHMAMRAIERGYTLFLLNVVDMSVFRNLLMDGIIFGSEAVAYDIYRQLGKNFFFPMVSASFGLSFINTQRITYVDMDAYDAIEKAVNYLQKKGHLKIAYGTPYGENSTELVQPRNIAFINIMKNIYGKDIQKYIFITPGKQLSQYGNQESFFEEGVVAADQFVKSGCDATVIICFNDIYAMGMMSRFHVLGINVPNDISIMGIDAIEARKYTSPLLTSVDMHTEKHARTCVDVLLDIIEGKRATGFVRLKPCIQEGETIRTLIP